MSKILFALAPSLCLLMLAGCASDGGSAFGGGSTGSAASSEARIKPECVTLGSRIETLRKEGVTERAAQAASTGKSPTVQVKRTSLSQLAELDKANAEFQAKCSNLPPRAASASVPPTPAAATTPAAKKVAAVAPAAAIKSTVVAAKPTSVGKGEVATAAEPVKAAE